MEYRPLLCCQRRDFQDPWIQVMVGGTSCAQGQLPGWLRQGRYAGGSTEIKICVHEVCVTYIYIYCLIRLYMIINIIYE